MYGIVNQDKVIAENIFMSLFLNYQDLYLSFVFYNLVFRPIYHSAVKFIPFSAIQSVYEGLNKHWI